jgi:hypothetical protein
VGYLSSRIDYIFKREGRDDSHHKLIYGLINLHIHLIFLSHEDQVLRITRDKITSELRVWGEKWEVIVRGSHAIYPCSGGTTRK